MLAIVNEFYLNIHKNYLVTPTRQSEQFSLHPDARFLRIFCLSNRPGTSHGHRGIRAMWTPVGPENIHWHRDYGSPQPPRKAELLPSPAMLNREKSRIFNSHLETAGNLLEPRWKIAMYVTFIISIYDTYSIP